MLNKKLTKTVILKLLLISSLIPSLAYAQKDLSHITGVLSGGASVLGDLMLFAAFVIGIALALFSIIQFKMHLQNPKFIPLINPIFYLVLGLILILLPFLDDIFGEESTGRKSRFFSKKSEQTVAHYYRSIDDKR